MSGSLNKLNKKCSTSSRVSGPPKFSSKTPTLSAVPAGCWMLSSGKLVRGPLVKVAECATSLEAAAVCCWLSLIRADEGLLLA